MKSRIGKYYEDGSDVPSRSSKNKNLYDNITEEPLEEKEVDLNTNEIDISKIKNNFTNREEYQQVKDYKDIVENEDETEEDETNSSIFDYDEEDEEKVYDINSILETAKASREKLDTDQKYKRLKNTSYDILSNLDLGMKDIDMEDTLVNQETKEIIVPEKPKTQEEELRELIDTITMKKVLEEENDGEVNLEEELLKHVSEESEEPEEKIKGIFELNEAEEKKVQTSAFEMDDQLQKTIIDLKKEKLKEEERQAREEIPEEEKKEVKKSFDKDLEEADEFFTSSYKFSEKDFNSKPKKEKKTKPMKQPKEGLGAGVKILVILLVVVIVLVVVYLINIFLLV